MGAGGMPGEKSQTNRKAVNPVRQTMKQTENKKL